jgi:hypothetical protein
VDILTVRYEEETEEQQQQGEKTGGSSDDVWHKIRRAGKRATVLEALRRR